MTVSVFAGLPVSDFARAVDWFTRLVGEPASFEAHETEQVWTLAESGHVYVVLDSAHAGHGLVTIFLDKPGAYEKFLDAAAARGLTPTDTERYGDGVQKATFRDPDGNAVGVGGISQDD